jgi:hypothetical protein
MPSSSGNGKAGSLRERFAHNQAERERAIARLEGSDWEEVTENHIHIELPKGSELEADRTGRLRAVSYPDHEATKPDHPKPESRWPERAGGVATRLIAAVDRPERLMALALLVALAAFAAWLRWGR